LILPDVNVLIYAYRSDYEHHGRYRAWLETTLSSNEAYAISELVLSSVVRIVTDRRVYVEPDDLDDALAFCESVKGRRNCRVVAPGPRHWGIFADLCRSARATANLVPDAYIAALAVESGCELLTDDRDFARFPGLRWRHPLDSSSA
jgi:hypothetical protein